MPETVVCLYCQRKLLLPEDYAGQEVQCPSCNERFLAGPQLPIVPAVPAAQPRNLPAMLPADAGASIQEAPRLRLPMTSAAPRVPNALASRKVQRSRGKAIGLLTMAAGVVGLAAVGITFVVWQTQPRAIPSQSIKRIATQEEGEHRRQQVREAFRKQKPLNAEEIGQELPALFEALGAAFRARDLNRILLHFNVDRSADEVAALEVFPELVRRQRGPFVQGMRQAMGQSLLQNAALLEWTHVEIKHIKKLEGNEAVVVVRHHAGENRIRKLRWWVTREQGTWQVFDFEDLDWGVQVALDAAAAAGLALGDPQGLAQGITDLRAALMAAPTDVDAAARKLERCAGTRFPRHVEALRHVVTALVRLNPGQAQEALAALERAHDCRPDMPCLDLFKGIAFNELNQWDRALKHLEVYRDLVGEDAMVCLHRGKALHGVQRLPEACVSYRKALDYNPTTADAFFNLLRAAPPGDPLNDLQARLAGLDNPHQNFDSCAEDSWKVQNSGRVEVLARAMQKIDPTYAPPVYYLALIRAGAGQAAEAVRLFQDALAKQNDAGQRKTYVAGFMKAMAKAGKSAEAYAAGPEPREAFQFLAVELAKARRSDDLRRLLAVHRKTHADDPLVPFCQAQLFVLEEDFPRADRAFRAGLARPPAQPLLDEFRYSRVQTCYYTGQALAAHAAIWPRHATFKDLCALCLQEQDETQLAALLAAHAKTDPGSPDLLRYRCHLKLMRNQLPEALALFKAVLARPALADQQKEIVSEFLRAMAYAGKPLEGYRAAPEAGQAFQFLAADLWDQCRWEDLRRLVEVHRAGHADDALLLWYQGDQDVHNQAWDKAIHVLEIGLKKAPPEYRNHLRSSYVYALYKAGRSMEAYATVEPRNDTFHQLISLLAMDRKGTEIEALVAAHRPHAGIDPDLLFYEARASVFARQFDRAGRKIQQACFQQPELKRRQDYIDTFVLDMAAVGQDLTGYRAAPDQPQAFVTLAGNLVAQKKVARLAQLVEMHGKFYAGTTQHQFYTGELHLLRGEAPQAREQMAAAQARTSPQDPWSRIYRYGLLRAAVKGGRAVATYQAGGRGRQDFEDLAAVCVTAKDARQLAALMAAHRQVEPDYTCMPIWDVELKVLEQDYQGALQVLTAHRATLLLPNRFRWKAESLQVRCLVKLRRTGEAVREVETLVKKKRAFPVVRVLAHAAHGGALEAILEMDKLRAQGSFVGECYRDPDLGPLVRSEPFRPFRERYPEPTVPAAKPAENNTGK